ncbi:hypothetical protein K4A83_05145 [Spirulina subsalsa FACHB-351]|uniref:Uncharacterized protein n=1 Tax=Spirulina subsalsa FACHB-351 TaxID=234711 RepID=A0ABT3L2E3_9CYAN|nr:hypothetical protein [Spirulina subsalsa]MCW6035659.1 hypothetical protein [Spirulina subsalsa FACHB-351]
MNLPTLLNVAIGLVFIYLTLSLFVSALEEFLAGLLKARAKNLRDGIINLLEGKGAEGEMMGKLYHHPLIRSLSQGRIKNKLQQMLPSPSYIPSDVFSTALLEVLKREYNIDFNYSDNIQSLIDKLDQHKQSEPSPRKRYLINNIAALARQAESRLTTTDLKVRHLHQEISNWFDQSMERASGVYKRQAKLWAFVLGFGVSVIFNADTFYMIHRLSSDQELRIAVNALSTKLIEEQNCRDVSCVEQLSLEDSLILPIGWSSFPPPNVQKNNQLFHQKVLAWFRMMLGWAVTALALAMGAPFWFDVLNKFINVRNVGRKPPRIDLEE